MIAPVPKPRRKRFQFSLRTLMIAVLVYAASWTLTATCGANRLLRIEARKYAGANGQIFETDKDGSVMVRRSDSYDRHGTAWSPAPFFLISHWDVAAVSSPADWIDYRDTNISLFGCEWNFTQGKTPLPLFIPEFDEEDIGSSLHVSQLPPENCR